MSYPEIKLEPPRTDEPDPSPSEIEVKIGRFHPSPQNPFLLTCAQISVCPDTTTECSADPRMSIQDAIQVALKGVEKDVSDGYQKGIGFSTRDQADTAIIQALSRVLSGSHDASLPTRPSVSFNLCDDLTVSSERLRDRQISHGMFGNNAKRTINLSIQDPETESGKTTISIDNDLRVPKRLRELITFPDADYRDLLQKKLREAAEAATKEWRHSATGRATTADTDAIVRKKINAALGFLLHGYTVGHISRKNLSTICGEGAAADVSTHGSGGSLLYASG